MNRGVLNIGLFGFGTVGRGLYDVLEETKLKEAHIKRVCVRDITKDRGVKAEFTDNPEEIFAEGAKIFPHQPSHPHQYHRCQQDPGGNEGLL